MDVEGEALWTRPGCQPESWKLQIESSRKFLTISESFLSALTFDVGIGA
jgi:hypothetical protein